MTERNARRYAPRFVFHPSEKDFPFSVEQFLAEATLVDAAGNPISTPPTPADSVQPWLPLRHRGQFRPEAPVYVTFGAADGKKYVTYTVLFTNNVGKIFNLIGHHYGDIEHITLEFLPGEETPRRVYFGAHRTVNGKWLGWEQVRKTPDGRPVVFVAKGSHAMYPDAGHRVLFRFFGFGNDLTWDHDKYVWDPTPTVVPRDSALLTFPGRWGGPNGVTGLGAKSWYKNPQSQYESKAPRAWNFYVYLAYNVARILGAVLLVRWLLLKRKA